MEHIVSYCFNLSNALRLSQANVSISLAKENIHEIQSGVFLIIFIINHKQYRTETKVKRIVE